MIIEPIRGKVKRAKDPHVPLSKLSIKQIKKALAKQGLFVGTPSGARTLDTLIKSQVLYQLS